MDIRYKLVRHWTGEQYVSLTTSKVAEVIYELNKWSEAPQWLSEKGYHPLVYRTEEDANEWDYDNSALLFECECEGRIDPLPVRCAVIIIDYGILFPWDTYWPRGTEMYERVKLTRRIR